MCHVQSAIIKTVYAALELLTRFNSKSNALIVDIFYDVDFLFQGVICYVD